MENQFQQTITTTNNPALTVTDTTVDGKVVSSYSFDTAGNKNSSDILITTKVLTADTGYYYSEKPSIDISLVNRDKIIIKEKDLIYDSYNNLTSITFDIYYALSKGSIDLPNAEILNIVSNLKRVSEYKDYNENVLKQMPNLVSDLIMAKDNAEPILVRITGTPGDNYGFTITNDDDEYLDYSAQWSSTPTHWKNNIPRNIDVRKEDKKATRVHEIFLNPTVDYSKGLRVNLYPMSTQAKVIGVDPWDEIPVDSSQEQREKPIRDFNIRCVYTTEGKTDRLTIQNPTTEFGGVKQGEYETFLRFRTEFTLTRNGEHTMSIVRNVVPADIPALTTDDWNIQIEEGSVVGSSTRVKVKLGLTVSYVGKADKNLILSLNNIINT